MPGRSNARFPSSDLRASVEFDFDFVQMKWCMTRRLSGRVNEPYRAPLSEDAAAKFFTFMVLNRMEAKDKTNETLR